MYSKHKKPGLFRRSVTFLSALALLLSTVSIAGDTWAWFMDNQSASVAPIETGTYKVEPKVLLKNEPQEGENPTYSPAGSAAITEGKDDEGNLCYDIALPTGSKYYIELNSEGSTVKNGYCLVSGPEFEAYTANVITENNTFGFEIDLTDLPPAAGDDLTEIPKENTSGENIIPEEPVPLGDEIPLFEFRLTPIWGAFPQAEYSAMAFGFGFGGPVCIENGTIVNEYCEPLGTFDTEAPIVITDAAAPAYEAASEHNIPLYYQTDYPNNRYGAGSIATSGCGIVSIAMVAEYMTGHFYDPVDLARWFGGRAENNIQRMEIAATTLNLPWVKAENINEVTAALYDGKIVIMMMDGFNFPNPFTTSQHFVVVRGITTDERYLILDPNESNYGKWELKEGFEKGFARDTLVAGYSGAWIFDPEAVDENYVPYAKEEYPRQDNYPGVELTYEEQELMAKLIWAEAQGECAEGQQAVAEVVLNRLVSGRFGETIQFIITNPGQFRGVEKIDEATPWQAQYDAIDAARYGKPVLEKDVFYFATTPLTSQVFATIGGHVFCRDEVDNTAPAPTEPEVTEPPVTEPVPTEPEVTEPPVTEPAPTEPEVTEPPVTEPVPTEPDVTEPEGQSEEEEKPEVPSFYQSDYPDIPYGEGTIEDSGSGIVSLAMAASCITGYEYTPDVLADWFAEDGEDDITRLESAMETLMLPWTAAENAEEAFEAVAEGKLLILRLESSEETPSLFTNGVHFLVAHGVTEDGTYLVNDPNESNYDKEELIAGYENGFAQDDFLSATHFWVIDPEGLDEDFEPYVEQKGDA